MDRIADSGSVGWGFESLRGHKKSPFDWWAFYFVLFDTCNTFLNSLWLLQSFIINCNVFLFIDALASNLFEAANLMTHYLNIQLSYYVFRNFTCDCSLWIVFPLIALPYFFIKCLPITWLLLHAKIFIGDHGFKPIHCNANGGIVFFLNTKIVFGQGFTWNQFSNS